MFERNQNTNVNFTCEKTKGMKKRRGTRGVSVELLANRAAWLGDPRAAAAFVGQVAACIRDAPRRDEPAL